MSVLKKKIITVVLIIAMVLCLTACGSSGDKVIGSVNNQKIYKSTYDYYLNSVFDYYFQNYDSLLYYYNIDLLDEESAKDVLADIEAETWDYVVGCALIEQIAKSSYNLTLKQLYLDSYLLKGSSYSVAVGVLHEQLLDKLKAELEAAVVVDPADVQAAYDADPGKWDSRKVSHIVITADVTDATALAAAKATAEEVLTKLTAGGDFAELAKEYGQDNTAAAGGVLDYYFAADGSSIDNTPMDKAFAAAAFALENVGNYTKEAVLSAYGYHIIKLDKTLTGFEALKSYVEKSLKTVTDDAVSAKLSELMAEAKDKATIKRSFGFKYYVPN